MQPFKRAQRVADLIRMEVSEILRRQIRDPRIGMVTITDVRVTDDLRLARIFFVEMGKDTVAAGTWEGLESASGFLKRELGRRLQLRYVPEIVFKHDPSFAYGSRIEGLLREINQEKGQNDAEDS
jgi:ribosome-binding factor A